MKWISHDQTVNRTEPRSCSCRILMLEAELLAEMLLAVVEVGFFPKSFIWHRSSSCQGKAMQPTGMETPMAGHYLQHSRFTPGRLRRLGPGHSTEILLLAAPVYPALSSPFRISLSLDILSSNAHPNSARPTYSFFSSVVHPTSTASHPCFPIPCDMNGITGSGFWSVCRMTEWIYLSSDIAWSWVWFPGGVLAEKQGCLRCPDPPRCLLAASSIPQALV